MTRQARTYTIPGHGEFTVTPIEQTEYARYAPGGRFITPYSWQVHDDEGRTVGDVQMTYPEAMSAIAERVDPDHGECFGWRPNEPCPCPCHRHGAGGPVASAQYHRAVRRRPKVYP